MTQYWANPTVLGSGTGLSAGNAFLINSFWSVAGPGDTLNLLDGIYTGTNSMIKPPGGVQGTAGSPITIRAVNEGSVTLNGQGTQNRCIHLFYGNGTTTANHYFNIVGINAWNGLNEVVACLASNCIFQRCVFWDAVPGLEAHQVARFAAWNCLVEDCAAFGQGRYLMGANQMGNDSPNPVTTFRRCFTCFHNSTFTLSTPKASMLYWYNNDPTIWENCISTWDNGTVTGAQAVLWAAAANPYYHGATNVEIKGCIAYVKDSQGAPSALASVGAFENSHITFTNCVGYMGPTHNSASQFSWDLRVHNDTNDTGLPAGSGHHSYVGTMQVTNCTGIGAQTANIHADWTKSNYDEATTVAGVYTGSNTLWVNNGTTGATVCRRYVDGTLTTDGLWPWPMNARIFTAMGIAGYTPINVTSDLETIFGTIPNECLFTGGSGGGSQPGPNDIIVF